MPHSNQYIPNRNIFKYKGYLGSLEFSTEDNIFFGKVLGLDSVSISYEGTSIEDLQKDFQEGVDHYLYCCKADKEDPLTTNLKIAKDELKSNNY